MRGRAFPHGFAIRRSLALLARSFGLRRVERVTTLSLLITLEILLFLLLRSSLSSRSHQSTESGCCGMLVGSRLVDVQLLGEGLVVPEVAAIHALELVDVVDRSGVVLVLEKVDQGILGLSDWL